jgi:hypothetical protein
MALTFTWTDWKIAGLGESVDRDAMNKWNNPTNIQAQDGAYADVAPSSKGDYTDWLRATQFGFDSVIPPNVFITATQIRVLRQGSANNYCFESAAYLRGSSGQIGGNKALSGEWTTSWEYSNYLYSMSESITREVAIDSEFGFELSVIRGDMALDRTFRVDAIEMRLQYVREQNQFLFLEEG